jgi:sec-independent protein translocase protein TatB
MFNLSGSEIVFLLLIALVVLGPEKLPEAVRKFGKMYAELKKMSTGFQSELRTALDEPMREMRETADAIKKAADLDFLADAELEPEETPSLPPATAPEPSSNATAATGNGQPQTNGARDESPPAQPADAVEPVAPVDETATE